jgi:prepilin-type N-terminal cleavage/methylation domain-containing protein
MSRTNIGLSFNRHGFTLVELLVAMALILFIMSIVSVAFVDSTESFRIFRARAELSEKLRFITQTLRADLRANHFENGRRLSDSTFWEDQPPWAGYFRLEQTLPGTPTSTIDGDSILTAGPSERHVMMFTSFLSGQDYRGFHSISMTDPTSELTNFNQFKNWLRSNTPTGLNAPDDSRLEIASTFNSPNAEIAWFLGDPASGSVSVTPYEFATNGTSNKLVAPDIDPNLAVYKLYRRVWPLLPTEITSATTSPPSLGSFTQNRLSQVPNGLLVANQRLNFISNQLDSQANVDVPMRRGVGNFVSSGIDPKVISSWRNPILNTNTASAQWAVVADNVRSFSVEGWFEGRMGFYPLNNANGLGSGQKVFDTWCRRKPRPAQGIDDASIPGWASGNGFDSFGWKTDPSSVVPMTPPSPGSNPRRLLAVRITIRLYDLNTKSTWQATVIEYL